MILNKKRILSTILIMGVLGAALGTYFLLRDDDNIIPNSYSSRTFSLSISMLDNGSTIIFPQSNPNYLTINYTSENLSETRLFLNKIDYGKISPNIPTSIIYTAALDGPVTLELRGFYNNEHVITDCRNVTFGKVVACTMGPTIDEGIIEIPYQLYAIIHDPSGDHSESVLNVSKIEYNIALASQSDCIGDPTVDFSLCKNNSYIVPTLDSSPEYEWKYREPHHVYTTVSSSDSTAEPECIGALLGDSYWGFSWRLAWKAYNQQTQFFNGTTTSMFRIFYGLNQTGECLLGKEYADPECLTLNPSNRNDLTINWTQKITMYEHRFQTGSLTNIRLPMVNSSLTITTSDTARDAYPDLPQFIPLLLRTNINGTITSTFIIDDDELTDHITCLIGKDPIYGTFIFSAVASETQATNPLEWLP